MTVMTMESRRHKVGNQPFMALDKGVREALADYARRRWPTATAKSAACEWRLTVDEAKGVLKGKTSVATIERIIKRGGWKVALEVFASVIGEGVDQHLAREREHHEQQASRLAALASDSWSGRSFHRHGSAGDGVPGADGMDLEPRRVGQAADR